MHTAASKEGSAMIGRFDPFAELSRLQDEMSRVAHATREDRREFQFQPVVDIFEAKDAIVVKAELPGVKADDVNIHVEKNLLTISGERRLENEENRDGYHRIESTYGTFSRSFSLPNHVNSEAIDANLENGILTLRMPKRAEAQPRKIQVKGGSTTVEPKTMSAKAETPSKKDKDDRAQASS
jgi:HSP20 family protein